MKLRDIEFGSVWGASGVQGFLGEGYPYHRLLKAAFPGMFSFRGTTFVAKTTTLLPREGNMPLKHNGITPRRFKPDCIVVRFRKCVALNAVGLSGPGAVSLFNDGRWQARCTPFFISFMAVEKTADKRLEEVSYFVKLIRQHLPNFNAPFGLQLNFSCPNVSLHSEDLIEEIRAALTITASLSIPLVPKLSVLVPAEVACVIAAHHACDAICISNTVPWGALPACIDWKGLFGSEVSPLAKYGGGGLSGAPLLPLVGEWLHKVHLMGITKPIHAGGGILCPDDVTFLHAMGAQSVSVGSLVMLRPWRLQRVIRRAHELFA